MDRFSRPRQTPEWLHQGDRSWALSIRRCVQQSAIAGAADVAPDRRGTDPAGREHPDRLALTCLI
ncbi:hypothetical protein ABMB68_002471 [Bradyrhizobium sp. RT4a]